MNAEKVEWLRTFVKKVPAAQPGRTVKRMSTLLMNPEAFSLAVDYMCEPFLGTEIDVVAAPEADGFPFGALAAAKLGKGFLGLKKYGAVFCTGTPSENTMFRLPEDFVVLPGTKILLIDDVLAKGDTFLGCLDALRPFGAEIVGISVFLELRHRKGREKLPVVPIFSVIAD